MQDFRCRVVIYSLIYWKVVQRCKALSANSVLVLLTGLSYVRHLKTVRTHLLWLVHHNKISSEENGVNYTQGLTEQVWRDMYNKGQASLITSALSLPAGAGDCPLVF